MTVDTEAIKRAAEALHIPPEQPAPEAGKTGAEKIEKIEKSEETPKKDGRANNGGARPGSGRKPLEQDEHKITLKKATQDFATGEDEVAIVDKATGKTTKVKMKRHQVVMEALYKEAKKGNVPAARELNDRFYGKAKQPITGGDEDDTPLRVDGTLDITGIGAKIYGLKDTDTE